MHVATGLVLPLFSERSALPEREVRGPFYWLSFQQGLPENAAAGRSFHLRAVPWEWRGERLLLRPDLLAKYLRENPARYAIVQADSTRLERDEGVYYREAVRAWGELVARFPEDPGSVGRVPLAYQDMPSMARRLLFEDALGPTIEIYRARE